jgi:predicted 3-demethylubiquinone-9 3-methyltransferase (glyoxalase superfamily)
VGCETERSVLKITPFLWFESEAEAAALLYVSVFPNSRITRITRYGEAGPGPAGEVMTVDFELDGFAVTALNGGPVHAHFSEAFSFAVLCDDQAEVDRCWERLVAGGAPSQCGWLKDRFGFSWQIVPRILPELLSLDDPARARRAMQAMLTMTRLDSAALVAAADGRAGSDPGAARAHVSG